MSDYNKLKIDFEGLIYYKVYDIMLLYKVSLYWMLGHFFLSFKLKLKHKLCGYLFVLIANFMGEKNIKTFIERISTGHLRNFPT